MLTRKLIPSDAVVCAELGEETVLLHVESGVYFGLDAVGTRIWQLLATGSSAEEIVSQMQDEYDFSPAEMEADVRAFLTLLVEKELTREVER